MHYVDTLMLVIFLGGFGGGGGTLVLWNAGVSAAGTDAGNGPLGPGNFVFFFFFLKRML